VVGTFILIGPGQIAALPCAIRSRPLIVRGQMAAMIRSRWCSPFPAALKTTLRVDRLNTASWPTIPLELP